MTDIATPSLVAFVAGIAIHILYFNRYETHMYGLQFLLAFILAQIGSVFALVNVYHAEPIAALSLTTALDLSFLVGAFGSMLVYRIFLNPLNKFPGPWPARIGNLYWSSKLSKSDAYYKLQDLHRKYGKFVRVGSNDLSIIDPDTVDMSFSATSKVTKAPWYDGDAPLTSMHTTRDKALHDKRRRVWAPAFSDKALREYEGTIDKFNDKMIERLDQFEGKPMDMTKWFNLYSFDVMGLLAFGRNYGMLESGEKTEELDLLSEGMEPLAQMLPTWLFRLLTAIPGLSQGYSRFVQFCRDELTRRVENDEARKSGDKGASKPKVGSDIMAWILKAYQGVDHPEKDPLLQADSRLIIVAGSDTTAATFTYLFFHLAQEPDQVKKIREELTPLCQGEWTDKDIKNAKHLNGAIDEALRLHPPVPSGIRRLVPPGGMTVGETFLPGGTEFFMPQYVMGRDDSIYPEANSFIPERWYSKPEMIKHSSAFGAFSAGPMGCIGKNLAYMELRTLTARILLRFDVAFAPGEDGRRILNETKDHFTLALGELDLVFTPLKV